MITLTFALLCAATIIIAIVLLFILLGSARKYHRTFLEELKSGNASDWFALVVSQIIGTLILFLVFLVGSIPFHSMFPGPQKHYSVELGPVYHVHASEGCLTFNTSVWNDYTEEGFYFRWQEGDPRDLAVDITPEQRIKINKEFFYGNAGKPHIVTYRKVLGENKLVSFYPVE